MGGDAGSSCQGHPDEPVLQGKGSQAAARAGAVPPAVVTHADSPSLWRPPKPSHSNRKLPRQRPWWRQLSPHVELSVSPGCALARHPQPTVCGAPTRRRTVFALLNKSFTCHRKIQETEALWTRLKISEKYSFATNTQMDLLENSLYLYNMCPIVSPHY